MAGKGGHILKIGNGSTYLDSCPVAGLTLLAHDNLSKFLLAFFDSFSHLQQITGSLNGRCLGPRFLSCTGSIQRTVHILNGTFRLTGDNFLC